MTFASNVQKTVITAKYNWTDKGGLEEMQFVDIIIDWAAYRVSGTSISNYESSSASVLTKKVINAANTTSHDFTDLWTGTVGTNHDMRIQCGVKNGVKTIDKFPWPIFTSYNSRQAVIKIENHLS